MTQNEHMFGRYVSETKVTEDGREVTKIEDVANPEAFIQSDTFVIFNERDA